MLDGGETGHEEEHEALDLAQCVELVRALPGLQDLGMRCVYWTAPKEDILVTPLTCSLRHLVLDVVHRTHHSDPSVLNILHLVKRWESVMLIDFEEGGVIHPQAAGCSVDELYVMQSQQREGAVSLPADVTVFSNVGMFAFHEGRPVDGPGFRRIVRYNIDSLERCWVSLCQYNEGTSTVGAAVG